jgi:hypothetical protein
MSPSEFDLRAALHDGEGDDNLDVEHLILRGRARAAQRRVRMLSTAAVVAVVAGAGVTGALIAGSGGGHTTASNGARAGGGNGLGDAGIAYGSGPGGGRVAAYPKAAPSGIQAEGASSLAAVECPGEPPVYPPSAPGSTRVAQPLFTGSVHTVVVCAYRSQFRVISRSPATPVRLDLDGRAARRMVASLENASVAPIQGVACPYSGATTRLAIIGVAADGSNLGTVTATLDDAACDVQVTNGTTVRYGWQPPRELSGELAALTPTDQPKSIEPTPTK